MVLNWSIINGTDLPLFFFEERIRINNASQKVIEYKIYTQFGYTSL